MSYTEELKQKDLEIIDRKLIGESEEIKDFFYRLKARLIQIETLEKREQFFQSIICVLKNTIKEKKEMV